MKFIMLLLLALPVSAATITHVIDLPDRTVVRDDAVHGESLFGFTVAIPKYGGDPSLLTDITISYSGHMSAGFSWLLEKDGTDLEYVLGRSIHYQLNAAVPFGRQSFAADPLTLSQWDAGTFLDYPVLIDQDFSWSGPVDPGFRSFLIGTGDHFATLRVETQSLITADRRQTRFPASTTAISDLQFTVAYTMHSPEPGTWIAGVALIGLWLRRRVWRRR